MDGDGQNVGPRPDGDQCATHTDGEQSALDNPAQGQCDAEGGGWYAGHVGGDGGEARDVDGDGQNGGPRHAGDQCATHTGGEKSDLNSEHPCPRPVLCRGESTGWR